MAATIASAKEPAVPALRWLLLSAVFALPWIDRFNVSTLLLCASGLFALLKLASPDAGSRTAFHKLFWLFALYYAGYLAAWLAYPGDPSVRYALQQKIAFAAIPFLLAVLLGNDPGLWPLARYGFVAGTVFALLCCLLSAGAGWLHTRDSGLFFYHDLVKVLNANAIYTSVHVLISIVYLIYFLNNDKRAASAVHTLIVVLVVFLFGGLLLLSSKLLIIAGATLILYYIYGHSKSKFQRAALLLAVLTVLASIFITQNRINERFAVVAWQQPDAALTYNDYSDVDFDGLNLRVLLWRMGGELLNEHGAWWSGLGGKHYHQLLNEKIAAYKLYEGYQGIDLHNQYMEFLVGFGVGGLLLWLIILGYIFYRSIKSRNALVPVLILIFSAIFTTESFLETQAGILIFTVVISGEWIQREYSSI
jgi:O-antigen ligase